MEFKQKISTNFPNRCPKNRNKIAIYKDVFHLTLQKPKIKATIVYCPVQNKARLVHHSCSIS